MSGTFPATPQPTAVKFNLETPVLKTQSLSGKTRRVAMGIQYYSFTARYSSMTKETLGPVQAFIASQYGGYDSFQYVIPKVSYRKATDTITTTPYATLAGSTATTYIAGSTAIKVATDTNKSVLKAGDFFKFDGHSKVYMINADWNSGSTGTTTISFTPALVNDVANAETLIIDAVPFTVILNNEVQSFDHGIGGIATFDLDFREVW
jgi:hypothetical protein